MLFTKLETPALGICLGLGAAFTLGLSSSTYGQDCGAGDVSSNELCLVDEDDDTTNGGCNSDPSVFEPANVGGSISGSVSTYLKTGACDDDGDCAPGEVCIDGMCIQERRDTDWYLVSPAELAAADVDGNGIVKLSHSGSSEAPVVLFIVAIGDPSCNTVSIIGDIGFAGPDCADGEPTLAYIDIADHPNGLVFYIAPGNPDGSSITSGFECSTGNNDYVITMEITDTLWASCGPGSGNCAAANGTPGCENAACCESVCELDEVCCTENWDAACADLAILNGCATSSCDPKGEIVGDDIGNDDGNLTGNGYASQRFTDLPDFQIVAIDDFTVTGGGVILSCMDVSAFGFGGFQDEDWTLVESWTIEIYSSPEAAGNSLTGDVASLNVAAPTIVGFGNQDMLSFDLSGANFELCDGTYWIGALPMMPFGGGDPGQIAIGGTNIGNLNAWQANPGGGFGFTLQQITPAASLAYRVVGIPIPGGCGPDCLWDLDGSGAVGTADLLILFAQWGTDGPADFDGSGAVGTADLLILFAHWGPC